MEISNNIVAIEQAGLIYPQGTCNPTKQYPEYPWDSDERGSGDNRIYDAVRNCFIDLGLDTQNYGKASWNPLGDIIHRGDTVLLKPNMVVSEHPQLECIVTNPAVVRAVLDYVVIALQGTGKILIGDAPMQSCHFSKLVSKIGYDEILSFYKKQNVNIQFIDFRNFVADYSGEEVQILKDNHAGKDNYIPVDLGKYSMHCPKDRNYKRYRVTNYDYRKMASYHNPEKHIYLIRKEVLQADVIINLPKPKTHRKAGYTAALKNFVGTVVHKECLPHHIKGSTASGGDEYLNRSLIKTLKTFCHEQIDLANIYNKKFFLPLLRRVGGIIDRRILRFAKDPYFEGSWYGNDTIWRTVADINRCLTYADVSGQLHNERQRSIFTVADMVISGEKEGPILATPKEVGIIAASKNTVALDFAIVKLMGFNYKKIPLLKGIVTNMKYPLYSERMKDIFVVSSEWDGEQKTIDEYGKNYKFIATSGWQGYIEQE